MLLHSKRQKLIHVICVLFLWCISLPLCLAESLKDIEVIELQERLLMAGYPTGSVNGETDKKLIDSARSFTGNSKTNKKDFRAVLGALREKQNKYLFVDREEFKELQKNLEKIRLNFDVERKRNGMLSTSIDDKFKTLNDNFDSRIKEGVVSFKYEWLTHMAVLFLGGVIGLTIYLIHIKKVISDSLKIDVNKEFNGCRDKFLNEAEGDIILASNKIFSYISYMFWDFYDTQLSDSKKRKHKKDIRYLVHFFAKKALDKSGALPDEIKNKESNLHIIMQQKINLLYYYVDLIDDESIIGNTEYRVKIIDLLKDVNSSTKQMGERWYKGQLATYEEKGDVAETLESVIYAKYVLILESNEVIKEELEKIFKTRGDKKWTKTIKKFYPSIYSRF